jgi:hypothetical protein
MKKIYLALAAALLGTLPVSAQETNAPAAARTAESEEAAYTKTIDGRTTNILVVLEIQDPAKTARVHDEITNQYRSLRQWQADNETKVKELSRKPGYATNADYAAIMSARKGLHDAFLAKLNANLTPEQVVKVKDKMTYNKVKVTYDAYLKFNPDLTDAEKARIMELLVQAREEAMDGISEKEKTAIFGKYKGKINVYLSAQGHKQKKDKPASTNAPAAMTNAPAGTNSTAP